VAADLKTALDPVDFRLRGRQLTPLPSESCEATTKVSGGSRYREGSSPVEGGRGDSMDCEADPVYQGRCW